MVFLNPKRTETSNCTTLIVRTDFVVKIVQIPRSPIFEAMGHTSVFPIDENEVADCAIFTTKSSFVLRRVQMQRSMKNPSDG